MRRNFKIAIGMLWLTPGALFLQYWLVWDRLPQRVATHFGAGGVANGWMSIQAAAVFPLLILLPFLLVGTVVLTQIHKPDAGSWAILGIFYVIPVALMAVNQQILAFNLSGVPIDVLPVVGGVFSAILLAMLVFLGANRSIALAESEVVAEEVHGPSPWALTFLLPLVVCAGLAYSIPDSSARAVISFVALVFVMVAAFTWSGFHYRFTHAGLEIRALGVRLRSIPREHIRDYRQEPWNWIGGYGIRGLGEDRAYVWGNSGVRIHTNAGSVFLGHAEPQKLIRDLDVLTGAAH